MVEMLVAAFVMAVGILGLTLLQVMAMQSTRGSRSLGVATLVAEQILDRAETEGRLSYLNLSSPTGSSPDITLDLPGLTYITLGEGSPRVEWFNLKGLPVEPSSGDTQERTPWYAATVVRTTLPAAGQGHLSQFSVAVVYQESLDATQAPIQRTVRLTRIILHA